MAGVRLAAPEVLLIECSSAELAFFARGIEAQLPIRVDKVLLSQLAVALRRRKRADGWRAAVTSFGHRLEVERRLDGQGIPVLALLAEAHPETLHRLAQLPSGTRVGVVSAAPETAHDLEGSIANAALPNIARVEAGPAEGPALNRLVRQADAIVCSTSVAERVRGLVGPTMPVILDDRALNQQAVRMLGAMLAGGGDRPTPRLPALGARIGPPAVRAGTAGHPGGRRRRGSPTTEPNP